jgi:hypothetical protein
MVKPIEKGQISLGFYSYVDVDSEEGSLADYLNQQRLPKKEAMLEAVRAYWLPLALEKAGVRGRDLERAGFEAVLNLLKQANYICVALGLDRSQLGFWGSATFSGSEPISHESTSLTPHEKLKPDPSPTQIDGMKLLHDSQYEDLGFEDWHSDD